MYGLPKWHSSKESACQCRRHRRHGFDPWVRKIPWRSKRQPTPVFLPGESHGQRSLVGYSLWGCKELNTTTQIAHTWQSNKEQWFNNTHKKVETFWHWEVNTLTRLHHGVILPIDYIKHNKLIHVCFSLAIKYIFKWPNGNKSKNTVHEGVWADSLFKVMD